MSVNITRISVKITCMSAKITRRVPKSHALYHTRTCGIAAIAVSQNPIRIFWWSSDNYSWFVLKSHASYWNSTRACVNYTFSCRNYTRECYNHTHTCQNHTLRVEITLVRLEITVVSVFVTFVRVKITLNVEITLCVWKSHSAYGSHTLRI
jgi:hypothetical protein